jgi:uncharacterized DUF497 family protein
MKFEWDENKNKQNFKKHRVSFEMAMLVFDDRHSLDRIQPTHDDEERWETIGAASGALILFVAHTCGDREGEELIRIISARRADSYERRHYEENLKNSKEAF